MSRDIIPPGKIQLNDFDQTAKSGGKVLFTDYNGQSCALFIQSDRLKAARFFSKKQSKIGAIYICKVKNAVPNLNAYFVEIGGKDREICYLSKQDASFPFLLNRQYDGRILEGDEFPVQITRDAQKTKQASVTTRIQLADDYIALRLAEKFAIQYSQKISEKNKNSLEEILSGDTFSEKYPKKTADQIGYFTEYVIRTNSATLLSGNSEQVSQSLHASFETLANEFVSLYETARHRTCFTCLKEAPSPWQAALNDLILPGEAEEILTDRVDIFHQLEANSQSLAKYKLRFYDEKQSSVLPLSKLYGLDSKLGNALERRIWLKSGGYLVIEPTEALTVIDVNSGKYEAKKDVEEAFLRINKEAAEEIALQMRLRNLSGIIVCDFINMKSKENNSVLMNYLKDLVKADTQKCVVVDMTKLGLIEITRKKSYPTLSEQIYTRGSNT